VVVFFLLCFFLGGGNLLRCGSWIMLFVVGAVDVEKFVLVI